MSASFGEGTASSFNIGEFSSQLTTKKVGRQVEYRERCESTMEVAQEMMETAPDGTLILTEEQTAGRGRVAGRVWKSEAKGNIYFTLILKTSNFTDLPKMNLAASVATAEAFQSAGALSASTKWPNDVWIDGRKAAGMLVDVSITGKEAVARLGIGMNINQLFEGETALGKDEIAPVSLRMATGRVLARESVLADFCNRFEPLLASEMPALVSRYAALDILARQPDGIVVMPKKREDPQRVLARAVGFSEEGLLLVQYPDGQSAALTAEEVSVRPHYPLS